MSDDLRIIDHGPDWRERGKPQRYSAGRVSRNRDGSAFLGMEYETPRWWLLPDIHCESLDDVFDGSELI